MNLKTLNVVVFLVGCILIYSAYRNVWPHMLVAKSLGRNVKPEDMWIDPDAAVQGYAKPMYPDGGSSGGASGGSGGKAPSYTALPWNASGTPFSGLQGRTLI